MPTLRRHLISWSLVWALTLTGMRLTLFAPEVCPAVTVESVHAAAIGAADWIADNQDSGGKYLYEWDQELDAATNAPYNLVRHAGTTMALYQFAAAGETQYVEAADAGLGWLLDRQVGTADIAAIAPSATADAKLGTASLVAAGLANRRQATGDTTYDDLMRKLGSFIVGQQQANGSMLNLWSQRNEAPVPELTSLFSTGEALWALSLLHKTWPDEGWDVPVSLTLDYLATDRDADENVWPLPWADQWAAYALNEMSPWGLSDAHLDYARSLAAQWGVAVRWESQRNGGIDGLVHAPENIAAGQGTWLEGLGVLQRLSQTDSRLGDLENDLSDRLLCVTGRMVDKQTRGTNRTELDGAFFVRGTARVDGQQHVLSGLILAEKLLRDQQLEDPK